MTRNRSNEGQRVLVVEDEIIIRWLAVSSLTEAGFEVLEAGTAAEALEILESNEIDLLFTDIAMPGRMNGLDLVDIVSERWPAVAVLVTSGHSVPLPGQLPRGGSFMPKPYHIGSVLRRLEGLAAAH